VDLIFDGKLTVSHHAASLESDEIGYLAARDSRRGQVNGLCGAAVPGFVFLTTGLHTGDVGFRFEMHDTEPELDSEWEDVVEVSYLPSTPEITLIGLMGDNAFRVEIPVRQYRLRYSGNNLDAAREKDSTLTGDPVIDRFLIQMWPEGDPRPDAILKQTSESAAFWNGVAQGKR
jgi:hypothetical protein